MPRGRQTQRISRRNALTTLGTVGVLGLAGCSGDGGGGGSDGSGGSSDGGGDGGSTGGNGGGVQDITFTTAPSDSSAQAAAQGLVAVVNQNSDQINVTAQPNDGVRQGMVLLDRGEVDFAMTDIRNANQIVNSTGEYEENPLFQDSDLRRVFQYYQLQLTFKARTDSGIETVNDFAGNRIGTGPAAGIVHSNLMDALSYAVSPDEYEGVETSFGGEPSMLNDGQVDAVTSLRMNSNIVPSYEQELNSIVAEDNQNFVIWPEDVVQQIQDDDSLIGQYYTEDDIPGSVGWPDVDELWWLVSATHMWTRSDIDPDVVSHMMQVLYDNADALGEYHPICANWANTEFEFWQGGTPDWVTTHDGAASFYQSNGLSE